MNSFKYCRINILFDSAQIKGGTVVVNSLLVPLAVGPYVELLV